jgi:light-regulated signal transduction histidine kinase (bacteriophytochrome)
VLSNSPPLPGFGEATLANCEQEQIHLAGSIRPYGALLLLREPDLRIVMASADAAEVLGLVDGPVGQTLDALGGNLGEQVRARLDEPLSQIPAAVRCRVSSRDADLDGLIHRPNGGGLVVEVTPSGPPIDLSAFVCEALRAIANAPALNRLCEAAARLFKELVGYDRVMVYRFDEEGHGEVYAEQREAHLEAFLGNRYPATDIPQIARKLYVHNRIRVLEDVDYRPVPLTDVRSPLSGEHLDMSLCYLRSMSPIHLQYLRNMGVSATMVASLMVGGRLWGLISCHHYSARTIQYELRVACELLAEAVSTRIAALLSFAQAQAELSVRRLEQRMIEAIARRGDWEHALFENPEFLLSPVSAGGVALIIDGRIRTAGEVPATGRLAAVAAWLDQTPREPIVVTAALASDAKGLADLTPEASGLMAVPLSNGPGDYLIWFRPERIRTVTWAGNPYEAVKVGDDPSQLSPRRSFAQWHQVVEGTCDPWTPDDITTGRLIGESVADVIQQSNAMRVLIARDQLRAISAKLRRSEQPVMITDPQGDTLLTNEAFDALVPAHLRPSSAQDLPALFRESEVLADRLHDVMEHHHAWRGEVHLVADLGVPRPLMVRADPVLSAPREVLGYVLIFTDLSARKAAEHARRHFQVAVVERHRIASTPLRNQTDLRRRDLLASIVGNAQLAALEITDGPDLSRVPEMLAAIESSVDRTTELLEHLLWYSAPSVDGD